MNNEGIRRFRASKQTATQQREGGVRYELGASTRPLLTVRLFHTVHTVSQSGIQTSSSGMHLSSVHKEALMVPVGHHIIET